MNESHWKIEIPAKTSPADLNPTDFAQEQFAPPLRSAYESAAMRFNQDLAATSFPNFRIDEKLGLSSAWGINFYQPEGLPFHCTQPLKPLRALILTSIRDVGRDEGVGQNHFVNGKERYLMGTTEAIIRACNSGHLSPYIEIAGIITDDTPEDLKNCSYPVAPEDGRQWIHPLDLKLTDGSHVIDITRNIPSAFRRLNRADLYTRQQQKLLFESAVFQAMRDCDADIILSDHFMAKIEYLIDSNSFGLYGRVVNVHPGITNPNMPFQDIGKDSDILAIKRAQGLRFDPNTGDFKSVKPTYLTGATFHVVGPDIDTGPVLADACTTVVRNDDSSSNVIFRNYRFSKNRVAVSGLAHYAAHIYPNLDLLGSSAALGSGG